MARLNFSTRCRRKRLQGNRMPFVGHVAFVLSVEGMISFQSIRLLHPIMRKVNHNFRTNQISLNFSENFFLKLDGPWLNHGWILAESWLNLTKPSGTWRHLTEYPKNSGIPPPTPPSTTDKPLKSELKYVKVREYNAVSQGWTMLNGFEWIWFGCWLSVY